MSISETLLLSAIQKCDKSGIDNNSIGISLKHFVSEHLEEIAPTSLEFLHTNCQMDLDLYGKCGFMLSPQQMEILLKYGFNPSENIILDYSSDKKLILFKLLFNYNVEIPKLVVYEWRTLPYSPALLYYLQRGGNPNIYPFLFSDRHTIFHASLIDCWIAQQEDSSKSQDYLDKIDNVVNELKKHGAIPSPYAMTRKENMIYHRLKQTNPEVFIQNCKEKIAHISEELEKTSADDERYDELFWVIERFEEDISIAQALVKK